MSNCKTTPGRYRKNPDAFLHIVLVAFLASLPLATAFAQDVVRVGSKQFNESYILGEIMAQLLEDRGYRVARRFGLGGTIVCYQALVNDAIDVYPEYSGTIEQAILKRETRSTFAELQRLLRENHGLELLGPFGFNNTYAIAVRSEMARRLDLQTISELRQHPDLRYGFSYEFIERSDGWHALAQAYGLQAQPIGMEHTLAYQALEEEEIDVMDVYTTDAEIQKYDLAILRDDQSFFPKYLAAPLVRKEMDPQIKSVLGELEGRIDEDQMQRLNARVAIDQESFADAARAFLLEEDLLQDPETSWVASRWRTLAHRTLTHLKLSMVALLGAIGIAIPFGIIIYRLPIVSRPVIYVTGLMQTVPSLALLALMIPLFGIGTQPALVALFLYALLPILRNTYAALNTIDPVLKKVSVGMGLTVWQRLRYVELPLATPHMLAGIRTAAVILIGTATLAAIIGAGGLGEYIFTGISLNDVTLIMWGAIPAALLAIAVELIFEGIERLLVPRHLLQKQAR